MTSTACTGIPVLILGAALGTVAMAADAAKSPAAKSPAAKPPEPAVHWKPQTVANFNWLDAGNWEGAVPNAKGAAAEVNIGLQGRMTINLDQPVTIGRLIMGENPGKQDFAAVTITGGAPLCFEGAAAGTEALLSITQGAVPNGGRFDFASGFRLGGTSPLTVRIASPAVWGCTVRSIDLNGNTFTLEGPRRHNPGDTWHGISWDVGQIIGKGNYIQNGAGTTVQDASGFTGTLTVNNGDFVSTDLSAVSKYTVGGAFIHKDKYPCGGQIFVHGPKLLTALPIPVCLNPKADLIFTGGGYFAFTGHDFDEMAFVGQLRPAVVEKVRQIQFLSGINELKVGNGNDISSSTSLIATDPTEAIIRRQGATVMIGGGDISGKQGYEGALGVYERLYFASGISKYLKGGGGPRGSKNRSIIPWMVIGTLYHPGDGGYATYDEERGICSLRKEEYESVLAGPPERNVRVENLNLGTNQKQTVNSVFCGNWGNTDIGAGSVLTITSGALKLGGMGKTSIGATPGAAGTIDFGPAEGIIMSAWVTPYGDTTIYSLITGSGGVTKAGNSTLILTAANPWTGKTCVGAGVLQVGDGKSPAAKLGDGDVEVAAGTILAIKQGVTNAILDSAVVTLLRAGSTFFGELNLDAGVNETVGALVVDGKSLPAGTYGGKDSAATNKLEGYFSGAGMLTVTGKAKP